MAPPAHATCVVRQMLRLGVDAVPQAATPKCAARNGKQLFLRKVEPFIPQIMNRALKNNKLLQVQSFNFLLIQ